MGENSDDIVTVAALIYKMLQNQRRSKKAEGPLDEALRQNTTVQISYKNHELLSKLASKSQTFDDVITQLLCKEHGDVVS